LGTLTQRIDNRPLPQVHVIDMREVFKRQKGMPVYSSELLDAIRKRLDNKEQVILFLNRRGYSNFVLCRQCGHLLKCENCSLSLTYHQHESLGRCHLCGFALKLERICLKCKEGKLSLLGLGTQKVEKQIKKIFPQARIERLDSDTTAKRGHAENVLRSFKKGEIDILIGTQMIAKGLDFPNVTLTGVVLADVTLHVPDFRSGEYTFQLLTQVAGRAGRGERPGEVFIQTFTPNHPAILAAKEHDFRRFYQTEMKSREELNYPPYTHFMVVTLQGKKEEKVREVAGLFAQEIRAAVGNHAQILGPMPAPIARANKLYRWQLVFRGKSVVKMSERVQSIASKWGREHPVQFLIDVDPVMML
jgi:primosomal protein N' (replication factor Y)